MYPETLEQVNKSWMITEEGWENFNKNWIGTAWKMSKDVVISGPYFPLFGLNTEISIFNPNRGKCGPEITSYLDTFHAVRGSNVKGKNYWTFGTESKMHFFCWRLIHNIYNEVFLKKCSSKIWNMMMTLVVKQKQIR